MTTGEGGTTAVGRPGPEVGRLWEAIQALSEGASPRSVESALGGRSDTMGLEQVHRALQEATVRLSKAQSHVLRFARQCEWNDVVAAAAKFRRATGSAVTVDLIRFALDISNGRQPVFTGPDGLRYPCPPDAPPPLDWVVWAHRLLDRPIRVRLAPDHRGRPRVIHKDPWAEALSDEDPATLPSPRHWDVSGKWAENDLEEQAHPEAQLS